MYRFPQRDIALYKANPNDSTQSGINETAIGLGNTPWS